MSIADAFSIMAGLCLIGVGIVALALCLAISWVVLATARRTAGEVERGER